MTLILGLVAMAVVFAFLFYATCRNPRWQFRKTLKYIRSLPEHKRNERARGS